MKIKALVVFIALIVILMNFEKAPAIRANGRFYNTIDSLLTCMDAIDTLPVYLQQ